MGKDVSLNNMSTHMPQIQYQLAIKLHKNQRSLCITFLALYYHKTIVQFATLLKKKADPFEND